jgi:AcrR family transcriptional regulator
VAPPVPPLRGRQAEGQRNRERLLGAARDVFAERGVGASLNDIARQAGIGNATLYRHFPSRRELIVAVYAAEVAALCAHGEALLRHRQPVDALFDWLRTYVAHVATKRDLALAIPVDGRQSALFDDWHAAMRRTAVRLLGRADPLVLPDVDRAAADLLALVSGIALSTADDEQLERCLAVIRLGTFPDDPATTGRARK